MTDTERPPVGIGQTIFVAQAWTYGTHIVPCPVCYGQLFVRIILGNGETVTVECDACGKGFSGAQGTVDEPCAGSSVTPKIVEGVLLDGGWKILSDHNQFRWGEHAFASEEEAEARRVVLFAQALVDAAESAERQRTYKRKGPTWSVHYHRNCLKKAERDVAYHSAKLSDARARQRTPRAESTENVG